MSAGGDDEAARFVRETLLEGAGLREALATNGATAIVAAAGLLIDCVRSGRTIFLCGNGGSAADAQHLAAELTGRFGPTLRRAIPAIALTTDTSALTAIGNDLGFEQVFARQLEALGRKGDVLVAISTSGRSPNVVRAIATAAARGMRAIALTGPDPALAAADATMVVSVPGASTERIQELHLTVGHMWCALIERAIAGDAVSDGTP